MQTKFGKNLLRVAELTKGGRIRRDQDRFPALPQVASSTFQILQFKGFRHNCIEFFSVQFCHPTKILVICNIDNFQLNLTNAL